MRVIMAVLRPVLSARTLGKFIILGDDYRRAPPAGAGQRGPRCHGDAPLCHGDAPLCHGDAPLRHGDASLCHGDASLCHGDASLCHGDTSLCHGDAMPGGARRAALSAVAAACAAGTGCWTRTGCRSWRCRRWRASRRAAAAGEAAGSCRWGLANSTAPTRHHTLQQRRTAPGFLTPARRSACLGLPVRSGSTLCVVACGAGGAAGRGAAGGGAAGGGGRGRDRALGLVRQGKKYGRSSLVHPLLHTKLDWH
jgi:hypothetical protein